MNDGGSAIRLSPEGSLGIDRAAALRVSLLEAFEKGGPVELDLSAVDDVDLSCVQLLYAARREAVERKLSFHLVGSLAKRLVRKLRNGGFVASPPESGRDLEAKLVGWVPEAS